MKTQYIILIPKDAEKQVVATAELFGQTFKSYEKLEKAVNSYDIEIKASYEVESFIDALNFNKIDLENQIAIPVTVKQ